MGLVDFLILAVVAAICGMIGQAITGYSGRGCLLSAIIGYIGALLGHWMGSKQELPAPIPVPIGDTTFPVVWSIIGSALFVAVISFLTRPRT